MAPIFIYIAFVFPYGMQVVHVSRDVLLVVLQIGSFFSFFTVLFSGWLSDRLGRKPVYIFGAAATGLFGFADFAMFDTAILGLILLATLIATLFHDLMWGPLAALTAECFTRACATAARRSAFSAPRCSPAARRRSSRRQY